MLSLLGQPLPHTRSRGSHSARARWRTALRAASFSRRPARLTTPAKPSWEDRDVYFPSERDQLAPWRALRAFRRPPAASALAQSDLALVQVASLVVHR